MRRRYLSGKLLGSRVLLLFEMQCFIIMWMRAGSPLVVVVVVVVVDGCGKKYGCAHAMVL